MVTTYAAFIKFDGFPFEMTHSQSRCSARISMQHFKLATKIVHSTKLDWRTGDRQLCMRQTESLNLYCGFPFWNCIFFSRSVFLVRKPLSGRSFFFCFCMCSVTRLETPTTYAEPKDVKRPIESNGRLKSAREQQEQIHICTKFSKYKLLHWNFAVPLT